MEMVAVVLPTGIPTGEIVSRNDAHSKGLWHKTVHVWIRNRTGEILLQKRADTKESHPGLWDISCAGHVSAGDSSSDAAVRELSEELGLTVHPSDLKQLFSVSQQYSNFDYSYFDNELVDVYLCCVPVEKEQITPDEKEVSDVVFYPLIALKNKLLKEPEIFVPHQQEYELLFEELSLLP
jgi:isopentenyldiphosphate isomerase